MGYLVLLLCSTCLGSQTFVPLSLSIVVIPDAVLARGLLKTMQAQFLASTQPPPYYHDLPNLKKAFNLAAGRHMCVQPSSVQRSHTQYAFARALEKLRLTYGDPITYEMEGSSKTIGLLEERVYPTDSIPPRLSLFAEELGSYLTEYMVKRPDKYPSPEMTEGARAIIQNAILAYAQQRTFTTYKLESLAHRRLDLHEKVHAVLYREVQALNTRLTILENASKDTPTPGIRMPELEGREEGKAVEVEGSPVPEEMGLVNRQEKAKEREKETEKEKEGRDEGREKSRKEEKKMSRREWEEVLAFSDDEFETRKKAAREKSLEREYVAPAEEEEQRVKREKAYYRRQRQQAPKVQMTPHGSAEVEVAKVVVHDSPRDRDEPHGKRSHHHHHHDDYQRRDRGRDRSRSRGRSRSREGRHYRRQGGDGYRRDRGRYGHDGGRPTSREHYSDHYHDRGRYGHGHHHYHYPSGRRY